MAEGGGAGPSGPARVHSSAQSRNFPNCLVRNIDLNWKFSDNSIFSKAKNKQKSKANFPTMAQFMCRVRPGSAEHADSSSLLVRPECHRKPGPVETAVPDKSEPESRTERLRTWFRVPDLGKSRPKLHNQQQPNHSFTLDPKRVPGPPYGPAPGTNF